MVFGLGNLFGRLQSTINLDDFWDHGREAMIDLRSGAHENGENPQVCKIVESFITSGNTKAVLATHDEEISAYNPRKDGAQSVHAFALDVVAAGIDVLPAGDSVDYTREVLFRYEMRDALCRFPDQGVEIIGAVLEKAPENLDHAQIYHDMEDVLEEIVVTCAQENAQKFFDNLMARAGEVEALFKMTRPYKAHLNAISGKSPIRVGAMEDAPIGMRFTDPQ